MLERSRWWEQDELKESLTLSEAQAEALTAHQERLDAERQSFRQQFTENQRALISALQEADRSQIMALAQQRSDAQQAMAAVEMQWWQV
ncbi:hypothetical protein Q6245_28200, partial [Klebsiella pneumoniae]|uniref:hypothetical protein n=1 Tax=Klebsiella pneumoniae TaxID=573 RepID=UPI0027317F56